MLDGMEAQVTTVGSLGDADASAIVSRLSRSGSEFQDEVLARKKAASTTPIAIVRDRGGEIVSWACTHEWRGMQTIEGFTGEPSRRRGLARAAVSLLIAAGRLDTRKTVCVFSPYCVDIARGIGCREVKLYERRDGDWAQVS